ncbi:MAG: hypothetical protein JNL11_14770 [Bdellovibrionaceae bacterium]|nr:hypothetical protein [Pseudobdellovibrionaceae bacterium]
MEFIKLKKHKSREISDFVASHLLFEYARNTLDPERKKAVEKVLETTPEIQNEFIRLINGMQYCEKLSETLVNDMAIKQIELQSSQVNFIVNRLRWHQWPLGFKWLIEAGIVTLMLVLVLNVLPLNRIIHLGDGVDSQNIIAEVDRKKRDLGADGPMANEEKPDFADEEPRKPETTVATHSAPVAETKPKDEPKKPMASQVKTAATSTSAASSAVLPEKSAQAKTTGQIFRGQFLVTNAEMVSPKIKDKIKELGGQKAGGVEIGWLKTPNVYYFHFTIPEAKLGELEVLLKEYSAGRLLKETHPRVMPDGIIRLLFTVEENPEPKGSP